MYTDFVDTQIKKNNGCGPFLDGVQDRKYEV